jgi:NADPH:quinone reductase-like Zn-dependent oxidoreductase
MKAIRIHEYGDANQLKLEETPRLTIQDDQILVRVRDAGVNPIDWKIRAGYMKQWMPAAFPLTIGQDFAGEVVERGKRAENFSVGQRVFGFAQGTYAEYAAAPASTVAAMLDGMSFETAAALPTAGSTALQIVRDVVGAHPGMTILNSWRRRRGWFLCHSAGKVLRRPSHWHRDRCRRHRLPPVVESRPDY